MLAVAMLAMASLALAGPADPNSAVRQFSIAVTAAAQGFTIDSKVNPAGTLPIPVSNCTAWLVTNDSATVTVYIRMAVMGDAGALPIAVDDTANTAINQIRIKPGESKSFDWFYNSYISIIGSGAGPSNVRFEQLCRKN